MKSIITTIALVATLSSAFASTKPLVHNGDRINLTKISTIKSDMQINAYKKAGEATFKVFVENNTNQPFTFLVKDTKGRVLSKTAMNETGSLSFDLNVAQTAGQTFRIEAQGTRVSASKIVTLETPINDN